MRARCEAQEEETLYRAYVTESLRLQQEHKYLARSWYDLIDKTPPPPERSGDEIALEVIRGAGLKLKEQA